MQPRRIIAGGGNRHVCSSTERFLKGKTPPGKDSPVLGVQKLPGGRRAVRYENGRTDTLSQNQLMALLHGTMAVQQRQAMEQTIRPNDDGTVTFKSGGLVRGKARRAASRASAVEKLGRKYSYAEAFGGKNLERQAASNTARAKSAFMTQIGKGRAKVKSFLEGTKKGRK